jgi:DNA ligase 1
MPDIADGDIVYVQGSAKTPYELRNINGVYSCSCPAWINQGGPIDTRTCKHLKAHRGEQEELDRVGVGNIGGQARVNSGGSSGGGGATGTKAAGGEPPVLLAHKWENDIDLVGWWMSEKLDGVRAWWDGSTFVSRLGNQFFAPAWFTKGLPNHPLDGELWVARKEFQKCVSIVRSVNAGDQWKDVKYLIFDAPALAQPFEQRVQYIESMFGAAQHEWARPVEHVQCQGIDHLKTELARVEALGGEGLMLRQPGSKYVDGRSTTLLKVKTFHDAEGRVISHEPGKGKHKGRLGALVVEMADGTRFNVGTGFTDQERQNPPQIGDIITYRYQELTKDGVPRFPSFVGLAIDKAGPTTAASTPVPMPAPTLGALKSQPKVVQPTGGAGVPPAKSAASSAPSSSSAAQSGQFRRFEMDEKFWAIRLDGAAHTVKFGKQGTNGQEKTKDFGDAATAQKEYDKLVAEKTGKGYVEVGGASSPSPSLPAPAPAPAPAAAPAPAPAPAPVASPVVVKPAAQPAAQPGDDGDAVRAIVKSFATGWRTRKRTDVEATLHDGCVFMKSDDSRLEGKAACAQSLADFTEKNRVIRYGEDDHRVDVFGTTAMHWCRWEMTYAAGGRPVRAKGTETIALAKDASGWSIVWRRVDTVGENAPSAREDSDEGEAEEAE